MAHRGKILSTFFVALHPRRFEKRSVTKRPRSPVAYELRNNNLRMNRLKNHPFTLIRNFFSLFFFFFQSVLFTTLRPSENITRSESAKESEPYLAHVKFPGTIEGIFSGKGLEGEAFLNRGGEDRRRKAGPTADRLLDHLEDKYRLVARGQGPRNAAKPTWTTCYCGMVAECRQNPRDRGTFRSLPLPCLSCTPRDRSLLLVLPKREPPRLVMALRHHESVETNTASSPLSVIIRRLNDKFESPWFAFLSRAVGHLTSNVQDQLWLVDGFVLLQMFVAVKFYLTLQCF